MGKETDKIIFESGPRDVFSKNLVTEWISAYNFSRKKWSWIPAESAFIGYVPKPGIKAFCLHHTMGLSAGSTLEEATANGIFEIMERDAYWNVMRCRLNCPDIKEKFMSHKSKVIRNFIKTLDLKLVLKDISLDWPVHIVHATLINEKEYIPAFSHGTGSSFSLKEAIEKAILEAIQVYSGLVELAKHEENRVVSVEGVIGNSCLAWLDPLIKPHISHLIHQGKREERKEKTNNMDELIKIIKKKGHEIFSAKLAEVGDLVLVRTYITGSTHPDDRLERISKRLGKNIKFHCPRGAYWDPILT